MCVCVCVSRGGGGAERREEGTRSKMSKVNKPRQKSDRYLGYCLALPPVAVVLQGRLHPRCDRNGTHRGHIGDTRGRLCNTLTTRQYICAPALIVVMHICVTAAMFLHKFSPLKCHY